MLHPQAQLCCNFYCSFIPNHTYFVLSIPLQSHLSVVARRKRQILTKRCHLHLRKWPWLTDTPRLKCIPYNWKGPKAASHSMFHIMAKTTLDRFHFISFSDSRWIHSHPGSMVLSQETFILSIFSVPLASASPSALQPVCQIAGGDVAGALSDGYRQRLIGVHGNIRYCRIHVWRGSRSFVLFSKRPSRHTRPRVSVKRCELSSFPPPLLSLRPRHRDGRSRIDMPRSDLPFDNSCFAITVIIINHCNVFCLPL